MLPSPTTTYTRFFIHPTADKEFERSKEGQIPWCTILPWILLPSYPVLPYPTPSYTVFYRHPTTSYLVLHWILLPSYHILPSCTHPIPSNHILHPTADKEFEISNQEETVLLKIQEGIREIKKMLEARSEVETALLALVRDLEPITSITRDVERLVVEVDEAKVIHGWDGRSNLPTTLTHPTLYSTATSPHPTLYSTAILPHPTSSYTGFFCHPTISYPVVRILSHLITSYTLAHNN